MKRERFIYAGFFLTSFFVACASDQTLFDLHQACRDGHSYNALTIFRHNEMRKIIRRNDLFQNEGISKAGDILDLGTSLDIITKRGSFYSYGDIRLGQGRENSKEFLNNTPELMEEIELAIRQNTISGDIPNPPPEE